LLYIIKNGGNVHYSDDLSGLVKLKLAKKIGGACYLNIFLNGKKPKECASGGRKNGSEFFAFRRVWEKFGRVGVSPVVLGLLKKFVSNYSLVEFTDIVKAARREGMIKDPESITKVWMSRKTLVTSLSDFDGEDDYSKLD
jgi:hypothetical protein